VVAEKLREGDDVGQFLSKVGGEVVNPYGIRPRARQKGSASGIAQRELRVGVVEDDAATGECIDVGRLDEVVSVRAERAIQIIDDDKKDIRRTGWQIFLRRLGSEDESSKQQHGQDISDGFHKKRNGNGQTTGLSSISQLTTSSATVPMTPMTPTMAKGRAKLPWELSWPIR